MLSFRTPLEDGSGHSVFLPSDEADWKGFDFLLGFCMGIVFSNERLRDDLFQDESSTAQSFTPVSCEVLRIAPPRTSWRHAVTIR